MWLRPGFIYENQLLGIDTWLLFVPRLASGLDIRAILFAGVQRLFLKLIPCRRKNRHTIETLALDDFSASSRPRISSNVRSGSAQRQQPILVGLDPAQADIAAKSAWQRNCRCP